MTEMGRHYFERLPLLPPTIAVSKELLSFVFTPLSVISSLPSACSHMCMSMRGVEKQGALTASTCFLGEYLTDAQKRVEFLLSVRGPSGGNAHVAANLTALTSLPAAGGSTNPSASHSQ